MTKKPTREQQKLYMTPQTRTLLRSKAAEHGMELSELVEYLIVRGAYPETQR